MESYDSAIFGKDDQAKKVSITMLGCGKIGSSMLRLWFNSNILSHAHIIKPSALPEMFDKSPLITHEQTHNPNEQIDSDVFVIAVKPQKLEEALSSISPHIAQECCIVSIAAGKSLDTLSGFFSKEHPIVRTMPNTPAAIGCGASVAVANKFVSQEHKKIVSILFDALGYFRWIDNESLMNAVTALSGSGPAYLFYLIEVLSKAGQDIGLPKELAQDLARQTVIGSAALAKEDAGTPASILRQNVTSPGGTTQAALNVLMDGRLDDLFLSALNAAKKRGEELSN